MVLDDVCRAIGVGDDLLDKHPAVVEVRVRRLGRDLLHAPVEVVIAAGAQPPFAYCLLCLHVVLRKHKL